MKSDIIQLFPKPIYKTIMPLDFVPITKWLNMQKMSNEGDIQNYGCQSLDTYIFSNKECEEISNYILKLVKDFGDKLGYQYEDYKFKNSNYYHAWNNRKLDYIKNKKEVVEFLMQLVRS